MTAFDIPKEPLRCSCEHEDHFTNDDEAELAFDQELEHRPNTSPDEFDRLRAAMLAELPTKAHRWLDVQAVAMVSTMFGVYPQCQACVDAKHGSLAEDLGGVDSSYHVEMLPAVAS